MSIKQIIFKKWYDSSQMKQRLEDLQKEILKDFKEAGFEGKPNDTT